MKEITRSRLAPLGAVLFVLCLWMTPLDAATRETQRSQFKEAMTAIAKGDLQRFYLLESGLRNYALHDHLRFVLAQRLVEQGSLAAAKNKAISTEREFHGGFLAWRIMRDYRQRLREDQQWRALLDSASLPSAPTMLCETLRAKDHLGLLEPDDPIVLELWQKKSWSEDCAWVMERQLASGRVAAKYLWQRVYALMDAGKLKQVTALKKQFNRRDQSLIQAWIEGHSKPDSALANPRWQSNNELNRAVFAHLISRLSRDDVQEARVFWGKAHRAERYDQATLNDTARQLSLRAASNYDPEALKWLKWLPNDVQDTSTREARIRLAVRLGRWSEVIEAIEALTESERKKSDWRYWKAVAQIELGGTENGQAELLALSETRSYYGFLAADRLAKPYAMQNAATPSDPSLRAELQARADIQRMREYLFVGLHGEAQAEWKAIMAKLDVPRRAELSLLVLDWGWFDRAIVSNGRTGYSDDLRVRFPFAFQQAVRKESEQYKVPIDWVYAVARRESLFQSNVRSGAGAIGLMQMMPATARDVAKRAGKKLYIGALENPQFNIALGTYYLNYLRDRFDGHYVMATAAYNAGLSRVPRWLEDRPMDADRWIESIPFRETREYVKAVMAYATVYDWRLDGHVDVRLSQRMAKMPAAKS